MPKLKICAKCRNRHEKHKNYCVAGNRLFTGRRDGFGTCEWMRSSDGPCGRDGLLFEEKKK